MDSDEYDEQEREQEDELELEQQQQQQPSDNDTSQAVTGSSESLGRLLIDMTTQVQNERAQRSDLEKRNHALMLEMEQLQQELLTQRTSTAVSDRRRRLSSGDWDQPLLPATDSSGAMEDGDPSKSTELWWKELQDVKKAKEKALVDAHQRALQVMELNACISMQHDELKALRTSENEAQVALHQAEERSKELLQQSTLLQQENQLLRDDVVHLTTEIGKRGVHFKALMEKWTEAQAQSEHYERENRSMLDKMKEIRDRAEALRNELEQVRDERDCLQHQVNHLKGAVAAKAAESKAFQAYGSNARDHMQVQNAVIQRNQIYRRKINKLARDSVVVLKTMKTTLASIRAPLVSIQRDFRVFLQSLQGPVFTLVTKSRRFADIARAEHQPLREALLTAEVTRRHLHEQLWRSRSNALLICQIRNRVARREQQQSPVAIGDDGENPKQQIQSHTRRILSTASAGATAVDLIETRGSDTDSAQARTLRANYSTGELFLRENEREVLTVKVDAIYSDRAREWTNAESVTPLLQSLLDGFNACVVSFQGLLPLRTDPSLGFTDGGADPELSETQSVPRLVLQELFEAVSAHGDHFHRLKLTISYLAVYNECIYDLLGLDASSEKDAGQSSSNIVVLEVQNSEEALLVLRGGLENLEDAHERGAMDMTLTHKVVTVCVAFENLLTGAGVTKAKLQIVELAVGCEDESLIDSAGEHAHVKSLVTMENGISALTTALADVRSKDPAFVRYHSSKLTVLMQDTVKVGAKLLVLAALPAADTSPGEGSASPSLDDKVPVVLRLLQEFRFAVAAGCTSPWGKVGPPAHDDRSVEAFMSRFTQQQSAASGGRQTQALLFSSHDMQTRARQQLDRRLQHVPWEKELEHMTKRYGDSAQAMIAAYASSAFEGSAAVRHAAVTPTSSSTGDATQHSFFTQVEESSTIDRRMRPEAAEYTDGLHATTPTSSRYASATGFLERSNSAPEKKTRKPHSYASSSVSSRLAASTNRTSGSPETTLATSPAANRSTLKIRRETASSSLKKTRVALIASPFSKLQKKRTPFR